MTVRRSALDEQTHVVAAPRRRLFLITAVVALLVAALLVGLLLTRGRGSYSGLLEGVRAPTDSHSVTVVLLTGPGEKIVEAVADETTESVTVTVRVRSSGQPGADTFYRDVTVQLDAPVGSRQVRAADGRALSVLD